ncbi:hypothetical protein NA66_10484 [Burkholderia pyrrocinia]|uniref:Uncharacterized protein n=1 Tax=Burkholderia pyrrocinia TaxID=60550 RepID=A0A318I9I1_BURPY|nr:hypothetical protein NA66_10484 [Burkholderia pyrrocinia]SFW90379.1 hypothetical protein SAMN03159384_07003 [Burkholderia sp. NFACC33-1]SFY46462.1 hypothetical protein SAMN03159408_06999 [Burkholderia sp. NFPP32]
MRAMGSTLVVELPPAFDGHPGLGTAAEPFPIQQFVTQLAVEALDKPVLPRITRRDEGRTDCGIPEPAHDLGSGKFGTVVRPNERWIAVQPHQSRQRQDDILRPQAGTDFDRQALAGIFIDHAKHLQRSPIDQLVVHEVVAPDRIRLCRTGQANVVATTTTARPPPRNVELQGSPHSPNARFAQRKLGRHPPVAEARHLLFSRNQSLAQTLILLR